MPPGRTSKLPSSMAFRVETFSFVFFEISSNDIPLVFRIDPTVHPSIGNVAIRLLPTGVISAIQNSHYRSFLFIFVLLHLIFTPGVSRTPARKRGLLRSNLVLLAGFRGQNAPRRRVRQNFAHG